MRHSGKGEAGRAYEIQTVRMVFRAFVREFMEYRLAE